MNQVINKYIYLFYFFSSAGIISLLDEEEPQLKVRAGFIVVHQVPEQVKPPHSDMFNHVKCHSEV